MRRAWTSKVRRGGFAVWLSAGSGVAGARPG